MTRKPRSVSKPLTPEEPFNLSFRPRTYWPAESVLQGFLGNIKGEVRRQTAKQALEKAELPAGWLLQPSLEADQREVFGSIHPMCLGGEFLPNYLPGEVEIARVTLASTTMDVYSIRARPDDDGLIHYRIVDDYSDDPDMPHFDCPIQSSAEPLTFGEIVALMGDCRQEEGEPGLVMSHVKYLAMEGYVDEARHFARASSEFYPRMGEFWDRECASYLQTLKDARAEEEDDPEAD